MIQNSKNQSAGRLCASVLGLLLTLFFSSFQQAVAEEVSADVKAKAQLTLAQWMKDRADDTGKFYFVDRQTNDLVAGYSANVHPMIVPYKNGSLFVCSEVVTENGDRITADFLTVPVGDSYKVIEVIMNNRPSIEKMMGM
ncbi:MAG: hypothetical protein GY922_16155 [Proteobacteria bacterium]|jgi:hypothetical protein|nr:hypothetical protein [Pseudomonadota bacterium]